MSNILARAGISHSTRENSNFIFILCPLSPYFICPATRDNPMRRGATARLALLNCTPARFSRPLLRLSSSLSFDVYDIVGLNPMLSSSHSSPLKTTSFPLENRFQGWLHRMVRSYLTHYELTQKIMRLNKSRRLRMDFAQIEPSRNCHNFSSVV